MNLKSQTLNAVSSQIRIEALPDPLEDKLNADKAAKIISHGILKDQSIDEISQNILSKLPKKMQTEQNLQDLKGFVAHTILLTMPHLNSEVAAEYSQKNPQAAIATNASDKGVEFICEWEKPPKNSINQDGKYQIYDDRTQKVITDFDKKVGTPTIGYGHAMFTKAEFEKYQNGINNEEALKLKAQDVQKAVRAVKHAIKVPLLQNQFDAFVSLALNHGSIPKNLADLINSNRYDRKEIESSFLQKNLTYSKGAHVRGLDNRRLDEIEMFFEGDYTRSHF